MICVVAGEWEKLDLPAYVLIGVHWHKLKKVKTVVLKFLLAGGQNPVHFLRDKLVNCTSFSIYMIVDKI